MIPSIQLKIAALAPIPRVKQRIARREKPGWRRSIRKPKRKSWNIFDSCEGRVRLDRAPRQIRTMKKSGFERLQDRARAVAHAEFPEDAGDVVLDRAFGRSERARDLLVAVAAGHQTDHLDLTLRQTLDRRGRRD